MVVAIVGDDRTLGAALGRALQLRGPSSYLLSTAEFVTSDLPRQLTILSGDALEQMAPLADRGPTVAVLEPEDLVGRLSAQRLGVRVLLRGQRADILAGQIVDHLTGHPGPSELEWVSADALAKAAAGELLSKLGRPEGAHLRLGQAKDLLNAVDEFTSRVAALTREVKSEARPHDSGPEPISISDLDWDDDPQTLEQPDEDVARWRRIAAREASNPGLYNPFATDEGPTDEQPVSRRGTVPRHSTIRPRAKRVDDDEGNSQRTVKVQLGPDGTPSRPPESIVVPRSTPPPIPSGPPPPPKGLTIKRVASGRSTPEPSISASGVSLGVESGRLGLSERVLRADFREPHPESANAEAQPPVFPLVQEANTEGREPAGPAALPSSTVPISIRPEPASGLSSVSGAEGSAPSPMPAGSLPPSVSAETALFLIPPPLVQDQGADMPAGAKAPLLPVLVPVDEPEPAVPDASGGLPEAQPESPLGSETSSPAPASRPGRGLWPWLVLSVVILSLACAVAVWIIWGASVGRAQGNAGAPHVMEASAAPPAPSSPPSQPSQAQSLDLEAGVGSDGRGSDVRTASALTDAVSPLPEAQPSTPEISVDPQDAEVSIERARALESRGDLERALALYGEASELNSRNPHSFAGMARILLRQGDAAGAVENAERAVSLRRRRLRYYLLLGDAHRLAGHSAQARDAYGRALTLDPDDTRVLSRYR